jgi:hypothetical protein
MPIQRALLFAIHGGEILDRLGSPC